jgi:hypothetical protein
MSFLDAMTCGFGAVILFFMIIAANVDIRSEEELEDRSAEARRMELRVEVGRRNLADLREALAQMLLDMAETRAAREQFASEVEKTQEELRRLLEEANANEETIEQLEADLKKLETDTESLAAAQTTVEQTGNYIRQIRGEGYRQYLTGLRMGGERVLILVDASKSMLDRDLPNVLLRSARFRNDPERLRQAPKWRQVVDSVDWLTAQIPPGTQFQVIAFNEEAWAVIEGTEGQWLTADDGSELDKAVEALRQFVPGSCRPGKDEDPEMPCGATSLHAAFEAANRLPEPPDNIYLLVDGLPTMGGEYPRRDSVTGRERYEHFLRASAMTRRSTPINVLLYPFEGDPQAAPAYWSLALATGGSLMAPSEDWP